MADNAAFPSVQPGNVSDIVYSLLDDLLSCLPETIFGRNRFRLRQYGRMNPTDTVNEQKKTAIIRFWNATFKKFARVMVLSQTQTGVYPNRFFRLLSMHLESTTRRDELNLVNAVLIA